jgi:formate dehydrogenase subunit delta
MLAPSGSPPPPPEPESRIDMDLENLIHMANRIGDFYEAQPVRDEALAGIADHIHKFWEPRMRGELLAAIDRGNATELHPAVRDAIAAHRAELWPQAS